MQEYFGQTAGRVIKVQLDITHGGLHDSETEVGIRHSLSKSKVTEHATDELHRMDGARLTSLSVEAVGRGVDAGSSSMGFGSQNGAVDLEKTKSR